MNAIIFVITHKEFNPPTNPMYIPLQVGRASGPNLGYLGDDSGDNISSLNNRWGELTGLYWIWKDYSGPEKYIGINHYRRLFINNDGNLLTEEDVNRIFNDYDIIASNQIQFEKTYFRGEK